jgi:hypothetical protein
MQPRDIWELMDCVCDALGGVAASTVGRRSTAPANLPSNLTVSTHSPECVRGRQRSSQPKAYRFLQWRTGNSKDVQSKHSCNWSI